MAISVGKIVDQVNAKIVEGGQDVINTARLVGSVQALESRHSVANLASLPPAADNTGRFIYVEDIQAYRYSDGTQWTNDYDTTTKVANAQMWAWGCNTRGTLGDGTAVDKCSPVREFCSATDWCQVSAGRDHSAAVKTSGELWAWGCNDLGRLGDGTATNRCSPVREFCSATDWCQVSVGNQFTTAVKTSGQIWTWGTGSSGRLGDGAISNRCSPVREICSATDWCQVSAGFYHPRAAAIKTSGELWVWGSGACGGLGDGTTVPKCSPVREFCSATNWCQVSAGGFHIAAVKTSGELWAWGFNGSGRLGDGTAVDKCSPVREFCSATNWCQVSAGLYGTIALKSTSELWVWGRGSAGQIGDGTAVDKCSPVREFCSATDWCQVSAGGEHRAAVKTSGQIWTWGCNYLGRLGDGTVSNRCSPVREFCSGTDWYRVSAGWAFTLAIKATFKGFNEP